MLSINNFLTDFLYGYTQKDKDVVNTNVDSKNDQKRNQKINKLITQITGDGNINEKKKIINIKVVDKKQNKIEPQVSITYSSANNNASTHNENYNTYQFYSPMNEII